MLVPSGLIVLALVGLGFSALSAYVMTTVRARPPRSLVLLWAALMAIGIVGNASVLAVNVHRLLG